jgi:hypothetical protein
MNTRTQSIKREKEIKDESKDNIKEESIKEESKDIVKKEPAPKKETPMQALMTKLNVNEDLTKPIRYHYPKVKDHVFPKNGYNYQADLTELPKTKEGYNALLVVVDIYSNYLDFEPLKTKTSIEVLKAFKTIFKRGIVPEPKASIRTDNGSEFKSVVNKYMYDNNILHLWALPYRHKQNANVENANKQINRVLVTFMSNMSIQMGVDYTEWTDMVDELRHAINDMKKHPKDADMNTHRPKTIIVEHEPKYKVGDLVYRRLEKPIDEFGNVLTDTRWRVGDVKFEIKEPRKVVEVLAYSSKVPWRYILQGLPNVSYAEQELTPAKESEAKFLVKKIIDKKNYQRKVYYLVWWRKELKSQATWEPKDQLLEDDLDEYIQEYEDSIKK